MHDPRIIVQRCFPTYDFVLITSAEPPNAARLLAGVAGEVSGRTFRLRRAMYDYRVEGSLVPSVAGSNVHVRVRTPLLVWLVAAILFLLGINPDLEGALHAGVAVVVASYAVLYVKVTSAIRLLEALLPEA